MTDKEKKITEQIKNRILELDSTSEIILYGSHARGESHNESDFVDFSEEIVKPKIDQVNDFLEKVKLLITGE